MCWFTAGARQRTVQEKVVVVGARVGIVRTRLLGMAKVEGWEYKLEWDRDCEREFRGRDIEMQAGMGCGSRMAPSHPHL